MKAATLRQGQCRICRGQKKPRRGGVSRWGLLLPELTSGTVAIPRLDQHPVTASVRPTVVVLTLAVFADQCAPIDGCRAAPRFDRARHKLPRSVIRLRYFVFAPHHETPRHFFRLAMSATSRPVWVGFANSRARARSCRTRFPFFLQAFAMVLSSKVAATLRQRILSHIWRIKKTPPRRGLVSVGIVPTGGAGLLPVAVPIVGILPRFAIHPEPIRIALRKT